MVTEDESDSEPDLLAALKLVPYSTDISRIVTIAAASALKPDMRTTSDRQKANVQ